MNLSQLMTPFREGKQGTIKGKTSWLELIQNKAFQAAFKDFVRDYPKLNLQEFVNMIKAESSFDTQNRPKFDNATASGLFQITQPAAEDLGTTADKVQMMSADQQLRLYHKRIKMWVPKGGNLIGKLGILQAAPAFHDKPDNTTVYKKDSPEWKLNKAWRPKDDGDITVGSIKYWLKNKE